MIDFTTHHNPQESLEASGIELHEIEAAFNLVRHTADWKAPIDRVVQLADCHAERIMITAVEWFTGTEATLERLTGNDVRVIAAGYRAGPAGG